VQRRRFERRLQTIEHLLLIWRQHGAHLRPHRVGYRPQTRQKLIEDCIGSRAVLLENLLDLPILIVGQTQLVPPCRRNPLSKRRWVTRSSLVRPIESHSRDRSDAKDDDKQENSLQLHPPERLERDVHCAPRSRPRRSPVVGLSFPCTQRATELGTPKASASVVCVVVDVVVDILVEG